MPKTLSLIRAIVHTCVRELILFFHTSVASQTFIQPTSFQTVLLLYILTVGVSWLLVRKISFDFVRDNKDAKAKEIFSTYFTFLLP